MPVALGSGLIGVVAMVGADLCGWKEQARRKSSDFQGLATLQAVQVRPIARTGDMAAICGVEALDRGISPTLRAPPCMSCHLARHFDHTNES